MIGNCAPVTVMTVIARRARYSSTPAKIGIWFEKLTTAGAQMTPGGGRGGGQGLVTRVVLQSIVSVVGGGGLTKDAHTY